MTRVGYWKDKNLPEEVKRKISKSHIGKPGYWEGKHLPKYVKDKKSTYMKKMWENPEYRMKMCLNRKGRPAWNKGLKLVKEVKNKHGYVFVMKPKHPLRNKTGYIRRSRIIMEKHIGRFLTKTEVIHHINGIKNDDRIENLMLFPNNAEHMKYHAFIKNNHI